MSASADAQAAQELKSKGNDAFKQKDWALAEKYYSQAIEKYSQDPSIFCNRALVSATIWATSLTKAENFCFYLPSCGWPTSLRE